MPVRERERKRDCVVKLQHTHARRACLDRLGDEDDDQESGDEVEGLCGHVERGIVARIM
jgi:hypothetical protein